ncbi:hypothetical protein C7959_1691, partial [Orenia marismortui]
ANQQGIAVYTINQDNVDSVLPQLEYDSAKKQEFRNLVNNGKVITVPKKDVTISGWSGTGYIVRNEDGTGTYMISGGLSGGGLTIPQILVLTVAIVCFSILASFAIVYGIGYVLAPLAISGILLAINYFAALSPLTVYDIAKSEFLSNLVRDIANNFDPETDKGKRFKKIITISMKQLLSLLLP